VTFSRFIALGDSFTEGLDDDLDGSGRHTGWADRVAHHLGRIDPQARYANLAVRGRLMGEVLAEQVPAAVAQQPDLVTLAAGVNDALRRNFDLDIVSGQLRQAVAQLSATGATVVVFGFGDPSRRSLIMGSVSERLRAYRERTHDIASEFGARSVDFWGAAVFDDDALWSSDRLHLSAAGHQIAARAALEAIGLGDDSWRTPPPSARPTHPARRAAGHLAWGYGHLAPWVGRRLRGVSSGDDVTCKRPTLAPIEVVSPQVD
jgi:lysophospholipase L1-like esterase